MNTPDNKEIRGWIKDLAGVLDAVEWDDENLEGDPGTDKKHPLRRVFDAISLAHMKFSGLYKERGRAERINEALFRISNAVSTSRNLADLYESIHRALAETIDTTNFYIALYNSEDDTLSFPYFIDETTDIPVCAIKKTPVRESGSLTSRVIKTGKPIFIRKKAQLDLFRKEGDEPHGVVAEVWLGVPLTAENRVIGVMVVQSYTDPMLYGEEDVDILVSVSEQAAIAIQRKRAEEALRVEKAHIERLFESVQEGIVMTDENGLILDVNPEFTRLFGYTAEEATGSSQENLIVPDDRMDEARDYGMRIAGGERAAFETMRKRKDGAPIHVSAIAAPISVGRDKIGQYTIYRDITEQKRANSILLTLYNISRAVNSTKTLEELFKLIHISLDAILDTKNFFIALYDEKRDTVHFPYFVDEKDDTYKIVDAKTSNSLTARVIHENKAHFFDEEYLRKRREIPGARTYGARAAAWIGVPLSIKGGVIGAVVMQSYANPNLYSEKDVGLLESISEQIAIAIDSKRTEEALSESEKRYRTLFDNAGDAIFFHDMGRVFLDVNAVACDRYGYSREEFLGMSPGDLNVPGREIRASETIEKLLEAGQIISETVHMRRDGMVIPCEMNSRIIEYNGNPAVLTIARDITERKLAENEKRRMEGQLQNARKMEAIGTLAGGVAHDLNNILSGLVSYPELLLLDLPEESPIRDGILVIQKSGAKAAAIVQDLLTLARRGVVVTDVVDLNRIVIDYLVSPEHKSLQAHHPGVRVARDLDPDLFKIMGSTVHLSKTVMNLISNAAEAMPDGGEIRVSTRNRYLDRPVKGYDDVRSGDYVTLTVSDAGTGISPEDMERIFEPFYTKKVMGRSGTGLGMAVVWGAVKDHNGYIDIHTEEGRGAAFTLYFPITRKESALESATVSLEDFMGRGETIVAVDDVEEQRVVLTRILRLLSYSVKTFPRGEDAVEYMKTHSADLLILDMIMEPGIDGLETYRRILEFHPGQKAIIVSGFSETDRVREARRLGAGAYVKKPYLLKNIGAAIREELDKKKVI